jgi:hypothetical protein
MRRWERILLLFNTAVSVALLGLVVYLCITAFHHMSADNAQEMAPASMAAPADADSGSASTGDTAAAPELRGPSVSVPSEPGSAAGTPGRASPP